MKMEKTEITDELWQTTLALIAKFRVSQVILGEVIGLTRAAVCNKLNPTFNDGFTQAQKQKIHHYMLCMGKVLVNSLEK